MGKVDDMRRQRELIYAQNERAAAARAAAAAKAPAAAAAPAAAKAPVAAAPAAAADDDEGEEDEAAVAAEPTVTGGRGRGAGKAAAGKAAGKISRPTRAGRGGDEQGACSVCGKQRPLQGGMVSSHQKGFGKACPGSRKPPAGA